MSAEQRANSVPIHLRGESGAWEASELDWSQEPDWWAGGHGLYSTPRDYLRFQRMLLGGGALGGVRILEPATVDAAFTNQIGELDFPPAIATADPGTSADFNAGPGYKFGLGLLLNTEDQPGARAAGSGAWAGLFNTHFWVDREIRRDRRDLLPDAAVRRAARVPDVRRLRAARCTPRSSRARSRASASSARPRRSRSRPRASGRSAAARGPARRACRRRA